MTIVSARFYRKLLLPAMAVPRFQSFVLLLSLQQTGCFQKPFSEFSSAQVAAAMGLDHIYYSLSLWKGQLCSTCKLFTSKEISFIPASTLMDTSRITEIIAWYDRHGWKESLSDMLVFDAVIRNTDRHLGNFGFLVDSHTNKPTLPTFPSRKRHDLLRSMLILMKLPAMSWKQSNERLFGIC